jgi:lipopolysaccharide transport system permease protein
MGSLHERTQHQIEYGSGQSSPPELETMAVISIVPPSGRVEWGLHELWEYRDLLYFLAWRDVKVRYKQTVIGITWAVIQPVLTMVVFSMLFGRFAKVPTDDIPYPAFAYSALVPWSYFSHALTKSISSLVSDGALVTQVYVPRLILPMAAVLGGLVDFLIAFVVLLFLMWYYGISPSLAILTLPLFILLLVGTAFGVSLWLAPLNAQYRDVANAIPFLTQLWLFVTPVAYPSNLIPEPWRALYGLNPMAGVVEGFRWALLGGTHGPPVPTLVFSAAAVVALLFSGLYFFQRKQETLADVV